VGKAKGERRYPSLPALLSDPELNNAFRFIYPAGVETAAAGTKHKHRRTKPERESRGEEAKVKRAKTNMTHCIIWYVMYICNWPFRRLFYTGTPTPVAHLVRSSKHRQAWRPRRTFKARAPATSLRWGRQGQAGLYLRPRQRNDDRRRCACLALSPPPWSPCPPSLALSPFTPTVPLRLMQPC
jgi:hypothetical protein